MCSLHGVHRCVVSLLTVFILLDICMAKTVPAVFIFGDSLLEVGNNNYIATLGKANFYPNGIDFGQPTGRFTNGRTVLDIIGQQIGVDGFIPPYLAPTTTGPVILKGVNYASGSGGILNLTGLIAIRNINMNGQLDCFANTRQDIISAIGASEAQKLLNSAIFNVAMGSNDFLLNYLLPIISKGEQIVVPPQRFVSILITTLRLQLTRLYSLGARKIVLINIGPMGCIPFMRDTYPLEETTAGCYEYANQLVDMFNSQLKTLASELKSKLKGSTFIYANINHIFTEVLQNYGAYGFENADYACCHLLGKHGGLVPCTPPSLVCPDRSKYVFWDPFHPSDAANIIIAKRLLNGRAPDVSPINIRQLLQL